VKRAGPPIVANRFARPRASAHDRTQVIRLRAPFPSPNAHLVSETNFPPSRGQQGGRRRGRSPESRWSRSWRNSGLLPRTAASPAFTFGRASAAAARDCVCPIGVARSRTRDGAGVAGSACKRPRAERDRSALRACLESSATSSNGQHVRRCMGRESGSPQSERRDAELALFPARLRARSSTAAPRRAPRPALARIGSSRLLGSPAVQTSNGRCALANPAVLGPGGDDHPRRAASPW
jgi:hypothetical protein